MSFHEPNKKLVMPLQDHFSTQRYKDSVMRRLSRGARLSYSQNGEDIIIGSVLKRLRRGSVTYLDIGAHSARELSNTYSLYKNGFRGVCVEPNPTLCQAFARERKGDVCLNVGISINGAKSADYYMFANSMLNTFSKEQALHLTAHTAHKSYCKRHIPLMSINEVLEKHFSSSPTLISIDTEGSDLAILQSMDFSRWQPDIFCIETITYPEEKAERKISDIITFMDSKGYFFYADTYINTIVVNKIAWQQK
jgi:FkbM family methyltransferase